MIKLIELILAITRFSGNSDSQLVNLFFEEGKYFHYLKSYIHVCMRINGGHYTRAQGKSLNFRRPYT